jgi:hypothetical protein
LFAGYISSTYSAQEQLVWMYIGAKNATFCDAIYIQHASFYQDRLGTNNWQTWEKLKQSGVFRRAHRHRVHPLLYAAGLWHRRPDPGKKPHLFCDAIFSVKMIINLPRQARDKHPKKDYAFPDPAHHRTHQGHGEGCSGGK